MARKVFFSFHFKRDAWRAAQVRNSDKIDNDDEYGVIDSVEWEKIEREGDEAIKRWIKSQLDHTSVTVVLIGSQTSERDWIKYEIEESWKRGNGLVGLRIHGLKHHDQQTDTPGLNPLDQIRFSDGTTLSSVCKTYDWIADDGRSNLGKWVEEAFHARDALAKEKDEKLLEASDTLAKSAAGSYAAVSSPTIIHNPPRPWAR